MKTQIIAVVAASLIAGSATAVAKDEDKNREEGIGIGSGAAIGAIAGGPVGLIIGAALGGWAGDKFHRERSAKREFEARYQEADALASSLEQMLVNSENQVEQLKFVMRDQETGYRDALRQALEVEIYFHTGESTLEAAVSERIQRLGQIMQQFEDITVVVEGHADPRGGDAYNAELSAKRATAVREALIASGVNPAQISTRAVGETESKSTEGDLDAMALARRVNLHIVHPMPRENRVAQQ
ncbi:MAG: OmpA family protein [Gammaproteobacteria bacterium]|nr:OmpA family protein [Gammaproteobacteria bacterium]